MLATSPGRLRCRCIEKPVRRNPAARWPLSGPAAALNKYEDAPHGAMTVREEPARDDDISQSVRHARRLVRDERLHVMSAPPDLPDVVSRAFDVSRKAGYVSFC